MKGLLLIILILFSWAPIEAQDSTAVYNNTPKDENTITVSPELQKYFKSLLPERDTSYEERERLVRKDKFIKRLSFHTNLVGWALLLPNVSVEMDLSQKPRTHYSVLLHGMLNGKSKTTFGTSFVFNVRSVSVEGRKYWRTGKRGVKRYHDEYVRLHTLRPNIPNSSEASGRMPHYTGKDSLRALEYNGDPYQGWLYNTYHRIRRNVFSGRTIDKARDWRAYYVGLFAGIDDWSIAFSGDGRQGEGVFAGISGGWSIPLFPQQYPGEGSLDLELGVGVGVKAVKYRAYTREPETGHYLLDVANSKESWHICPYPVVQDVHVSLVWRFRGIKHKVDRSLIDDYEKRIDAFVHRRDRHEAHEKEVRDERDKVALVAPLEEILKRAQQVLTDFANADTSGQATPILALAIEQAKKDTADLVLGIAQGKSEAERNMERELIARELQYYMDVAMKMVDTTRVSPVGHTKPRKQTTIKRESNAAKMLEARKKKKTKNSEEETTTNTSASEAPEDDKPAPTDNASPEVTESPKNDADESKEGGNENE